MNNDHDDILGKNPKATSTEHEHQSSSSEQAAEKQIKKNRESANDMIRIDLGIGTLAFDEPEITEASRRIATEWKHRGLDNLTFGTLLGEDPATQSPLHERCVQEGLIGIFGPARQGKTTLAQAVSQQLNIPYYRVLEPAETFNAVNADSLTLDDVVRDIKRALLSSDPIVIIDSSRFVNSIRDFGLTTAGTPMAYNVILTLLHNMAVKLHKLILLVISAITNESVHIGLLRDMIIGSCYGIIEPSILSGGGRISIRGGTRDFIPFTCHFEYFTRIMDEAGILQVADDVKEQAHPDKSNAKISAIHDPERLNNFMLGLTERTAQLLDETKYADKHGQLPGKARRSMWAAYGNDPNNYKDPLSRATSYEDGDDQRK